jgi:catechol-2,3-dioxygenase
MEIKMNQPELHPAVRIGHVHLRVAALGPATAFYRDVLGFTITIDGRTFGLQFVHNPQRGTVATPARQEVQK